MRYTLLLCVSLFSFSAGLAQTVSFSGTVYDSGTESPSSGTPTNKVGDKQLYAIYSSAFGFGLNGQPDNAKIVASVPIEADGTYRFSNVPKIGFGQVSLAVSTDTVGAQTPSAFLPNTVRAGAVDNRLQTDFGLNYIILDGVADNATINFRFNQRPTANSITVPTQLIVDNGNTQVPIPALTGSDPEDGIYNGISGTTVAITSIYPNPVLIYKGQVLDNYTFVSNFPPYYLLENYDPSQLKIIPAKGQKTATIDYYVLDAAKRWSLNPGTVTMTFEATTALPVELTYFSGKWIKGEGNQLSWETAWERNNDRFEIQRSADAKGFESIGRVVGNTIASTRHVYKFMDSQPLVNVTYYRLKQFDIDGKFSYSKTIAVQMDEPWIEESLLVYPNPTSDFLQLRLTNHQTICETKIYTESGQQVLFQSGVDLRVDVRLLVRGIYLIEMKTASGQVLRQRFVKQ